MSRSHSVPPLEVHILPDHGAASDRLARDLLAFVAARPGAVLALPSGQTPLALYERLAREPARTSLAGVTVFALDEFRGLGGEDPRSFRAFFDTHVFGPLGLSGAQAHVLDGLADDPGAACARYEAAIREAGGLDLTLLGLGANGHIAFNEPADRLEARTHVARLAEPSSSIAPEGLTMGVGTLLSAPEVWLVATGEGKAEAVRHMLEGPLDPRWPASMLQLHPCVRVILDKAAASRLQAISSPVGP